MTNKEKAQEFMRLHQEKDPRCKMLIMFLGTMFMLSEEEVLRHIKAIADEK